MSLRKAALSIQFSGGVELRQDSKQVPTTRLIDLQNGIFTKQTSIQKRNGYAARATTMTNPRGLASRGREILRFSDQRSESYLPASDTWADAGEIAATTATTLPIARTGTFQTGPDIADRDGVRVVAWEDSRGGVWCTVLDSTTSHVLLPETQLDSAALARNPRCVACGPFDLAVLWTREDLHKIQSAHIDTGNPTQAPTIQLFSDDLDPALPFFDAEHAPNGPNAVFSVRPAIAAWAKQGGGIRVGWINALGAIGTPLTGVSSSVTHPDVVSGPVAVTWDPASSIVAICWISGAAHVAVRFVHGNALQTTTRTATALGAGAPSYSRLTAAFGGPDANGTPILYWAAESGTTRTDLTFIDAGAARQGSTSLDAASTRLRGHGLASRAWHDGAELAPAAGAPIDGDAYVMVAHTVRFFPYVAAIRLSDSSGISSPNNTIVARLMPGEASGSIMHVVGTARAWSPCLPSVIAIDLDDANVYARQHAAPIPYRIQLSSQDGDQFSEQGIKLASLDFDVRYQTVEYGRGLYLASAAMQHYDGAQWREADFHTAPDLGFDAAGAPVSISTAITIGAAGAIPNGTYLYAFWYEAMDAQGELHRGAVSVKVLVTMTGGPKKFSIALPTCRLTRFATSRICVARSAQGATGTDSTLELFKVTSNDATITTGDNRFVANDVTVDTVTFTDNLTDAVLITREPLYTNGGILSNDPAPSSGRVIAAAKGRLLWTDSTDLCLIRHTQPIEDDTAFQGPIGLGVSVDAFGGPITAIGSLDDLIVPFKRDAIFGFGGPGPLQDPAVDPATNSFSPAERITSDVGCLSGTSLGDTPLGITFVSSKGIKLLSRARQVVDIGNPVESLASQSFRRTTLLPDRKAIIFLTDTAEGFTLLWDYDRNQWSKFSNHVGLDAVVVDGGYYYMREDGQLYQETVGVYLDDTKTIQLQIETAWIHFAQYLQGWQKILWAYWLGEHISSHTLSVQYRLDYNTAYSEPILSDVDNNIVLQPYGDAAYGNGSYGGLGNGQRYQRRNHINRRCQAISFLIKDVEGDSGGIIAPSGASFELSELLVIGGGVGPAFKPGASRSR